MNIFILYPRLSYIPDLGYLVRDSDKVDRSGRKCASEIDNSRVITVASSEGNLIVQHRMDSAWVVPVSILWNKDTRLPHSTYPRIYQDI